MKRFMFMSVLALSLALGAWSAQAQVAANDTSAIGNGVLVVRATVQESPARITLTWPLVSGSGGFKIYRKAREAGSFGSIYATVTEGTTSYGDTNVVVGTGYEYEVVSVATVGGLTLYGFVYSGIALPTVDSRGKVILLVDNTMTNALAGELARFEQDLVGDGWTVLRHDVTRQTTVAHNATTTEVATIKAIINNDYTNDTANVKTVLLFGRVPIPYSGQLNPDGHGATAREADSYYAVPSETWTDSTVSNVAIVGQFANVPGDSVYDQSNFSASNVKLGVGRVDMSAMPIFVLSETELLRRYLNKDHAFRHRLNASATAGGLSGGLVSSRTAFSDLTLFDANMVNTVPGMVLWSHVEGPAIINWSFGLRNSFNPTYHVFTGVWGSGSIDYDKTDSSMGMGRNYLASAGACLAWTCGQPNRYFHGMAMGETIGNCQRLGMANGSLYPSGANGNMYYQIHNNLLADPTLRLQMLAPPRALTIAGNTLSWDASMEADVTGFQGYHVYRATSPAGPFTRLTSTPVTATSWTDPSPLGGDVYQVRAIKLETSPAGSYYNNSQGVFATRDTVGIVASLRRLVVPEGGTGSFQVKLSSAPASNVTITAAQVGGDSAIGVRSGSSLTFTPGNWNVWQPVTLATAWDYDNIDGNAAILLSAPGLSNVTVGAVMADAEVLVRSDLSPDGVGNYQLDEGGMGAVQVRLSRPPAAQSVTVNTGYGTSPGVTPSAGYNNFWVQAGDTLTFTQDNWDEWQTVTLAAVEVYNATDGAGQFKVSTPGYREAYFTASCPEKHSLLQATVTPASSGTASPSGYSTVVMGTPTRISATAAAGYRFSSWSTVASDDSVVIANPASADTTATVYYGNNGRNDIVANFVPDNQSVVTNTVERETLSVGVPEGGTAAVRVRLTAPPAGDVTVTAAPQGWTGSDPDITVQSGALTFGTTNWNVWQTMTLAASNDANMVSGKTKIAIGGIGLATSYVRAYEIDRDLTVSVGFGVGGLSVTPVGAMAAIKGAPMAIRARANTGYQFAGWRVVGGSAPLADASAPCTTITPDSSASVLAEFNLIRDSGAAADCAITPSGNVVVNAGTNLTFTATASALVSGRTISKVEFFRDGVLLGEDGSAPYTLTWTNVPAGFFVVTARATDSQGETGDSAGASVYAVGGDASPWVAGMGGSVTNYTANGTNWTRHTFTDTQNASLFVVTSPGTIEYLVVGGGGGGGNGGGGGGGGGGGIVKTGSVYMASGAYSVVVGSGGDGGTSVTDGGNGSPSSIGGVIAASGGGGGGGAGASYGNGGGSGSSFSTTATPGGIGTDGGKNGGAGDSDNNWPACGGGGGGMGANGTDAGSGSAPGNGGNGIASSISGASVTYGGGGGGGNRSTSDGAGAGGTGGSGGGGHGGGQGPSLMAVAGTDTLGGGGGAGGGGASVYDGAKGGSGIVIVRYVGTGPALAVIYEANGATGGTVPAAQGKITGTPLTLATNSGNLVRSGYTFAGWNTAANGTGTDYAPGASYTANAAVTLFAKWTAPTYAVSYDANGATSGTAPAQQNKTHDVALTLANNTGGLVRAGYTFAGWNTAANGTGTDYPAGASCTANVAMTLYAKWTAYGNRPPAIISIWADPAVVTQPTGTTVHVTALDPLGGALDYSWSQISGPGTATFASPYSSASAATFSQSGSYVLRVFITNVRGETALADVTVMVAGVVTDVSSLSVPEGSTNSFQAKLSAQPASNVTVTVAPASGDTNITVQSGASLTFTTNNWNVWQTVVLAASEDADVANDSAVFSLALGGAVGATVVATETDNDATLRINAGAGGTVAPSGSQVVTKGVALPIVATPQTGYSLVQWVVTEGSATVADIHATNTTVIVTAGPATIRANFVNNANPGQTVTMAWGYNNRGQLGDGGAADSYYPEAITNCSGADAIFGGYWHTIAHKPDGTVWDWGYNAFGQLGDGTTADKTSPAQVPGLAGVAAVAAGSYHTVVAKSNGTVWAWGYNVYGEVGNGNTGTESNPVQVAISGIAHISAGGYHTVALHSNGTVWAWGLNNSGQIGDGTIGTNRLSPVQVLMADSSPFSNATAVAAGIGHTVALTSDGTVLAWGSNGSGQLGDGTSGTNRLNPVQVKMADGSALSNVTAVAAGGYHTVARKADGTVWVWGSNGYGQLGDGTSGINRLTPVQVALSNVIAVAAGGYHTLAIKDDGSVWAWGYNANGQLGRGTSDTDAHTTPVQVAASDGSSLYGATAIGAGDRFSLALFQKQVYVRIVTDVVSASVPEGGTATFQVKLSAQPPGSVNVTAARLSGDADITTSSSLTFTTNNWSTYQTVTLAAAEDSDTVNGSAVIALTGSAGVDSGATVLANEVDNDVSLTVNTTPGGTVSPAGAGAATQYAATPITAVPGPGYVFGNWTVVSGAALIADPYATNTTVLLTGAAGIQANFVPLGENRPPVIGVVALADPVETRLPSAVTTASVAASDPDGDTLTYAWSQVSGQGQANFITPAEAQSLVTFNAAGIYGLRVTVSDGRGGAVSSDMSVTVNRMLAFPVITQQPSDMAVCTNQTAAFGVAATGEAISYQWYRNGVELFSGTGAGYTTPPTTMADSGAKFKVRVSNASGSVMSDEATLTVINDGVGTGLTGKYYDNMDFTSNLLTRVDSSINFGGYTPAYPFTLSTMSARWTGQFRAIYSGATSFHAYSSGSVRLWVNGVLVAASWPGSDVGNRTDCYGSIPLVAGQKYDLRLDYSCVSAGGGVALECPVGTYCPTAQLYPSISGTNYAPTVPAGAVAADNTVVLPAGTTVSVAAFDQDNDPLTYAWSQVSGPGTATFGAPTGTASTVGFSAAGTYVLRSVVADDHSHSVTSDVSVAVVASNATPFVILSSPTAGVQEGVDMSGGVSVRLSHQPAGSVAMTVARVSGSTAIDTQGTIPSFGTNDWSTYKGVAFRGFQDADTTNDTAVFTFSAPGYASATCTVTQTDNDTLLTVVAGVGGSVSPAGATVVTKGAATAISTVTTNGYCFSGWTVTSGSASIDNPGTENTTVTISAPATVRANFVPVGLALVRSATSVSVPEGGTNTFQVKLPVPPTEDVIVAVTRTDGDSDLSVSNGASLTFTPANWDTYQTVTLAAAEDADTVNGTATFLCSATGLISVAVTATEVENDTTALTILAGPGGVVSPSGAMTVPPGDSVAISATANDGYAFANWSLPNGSGTFANVYATNTTVVLTTTSATVRANFALIGMVLVRSASSVSVPEGGANTFQLKLSSKPPVDIAVTVARTAGDTNITVTGGASLTFTTNNWDTYQTVTLAAAEDADTVNGSATITCSSPDADSVIVTATEADNDTTLTVTAGTGGSTVPSGATVVTQGAARGIAATANAGYGFVNWNVTSGAATFANSNAASTTVTISAPATIQANFIRVAIQTSVSLVGVPEGGTAKFRVTLTAQPAGSVTVSVAHGGDSQLSVVSGSSLVFSTSDWALWKTVTLADAEDGVTNRRVATFTCSSAGMDPVIVTATGIDNDGPVPADSDGDGLSDALEARLGRATNAIEVLTALPFTEHFESDTVNLGLLNGQHNWVVKPTNAATVQASDVFEGAHALRIEGTNDSPVAVSQAFTSTPQTVWLDLRLKVAGAAAPGSIPDAATVFFFSEEGRLVVCDGMRSAGPQWITLSNVAPRQAGTWARLTARADYTLQTWALYLDGTNVAANLGFAMPQKRPICLSAEGPTGVLDSLYVGAARPAGIPGSNNTAPDDWYLDFLGTLVYGDADDPDGDGMNNLAEYLAGTNPNDIRSLLEVTETTVNPANPGEFIVRWQSAAGRVYTLQAATNLMTDFSTLTNGIPATPTVNVYTDSVNGAGQKFYRVGVE